VWSQDHVDRPVTSALKVAAQMRSGRTEVLYLADSTMIHISPDDSDRRRLGEMFVDESGYNTAQYYGPAYPPAVYTELLRLIEPYPRPRAIVLSMPIRPSTHLHATEHPVFSYRHARRSLARARRVSSLTTRVLRPRPTKDDYDRFYAVVRNSRWGGERTIGDFRRELRGIVPTTASAEQLRVMWDYFHGEFSDDTPGLDDWVRLGEQARALGVPVIAYRAHMPYEYGTRLFGPEFVAHVDHNFAILEQALKKGLGDGGIFLDVPPPPDSHFIQPEDGTEHWNEEGRRARVEFLKGALADVVGGPLRRDV
jgi:hypothetical protein